MKKVMLFMMLAAFGLTLNLNGQEQVKVKETKPAKESTVKKQTTEKVTDKEKANQGKPESVKGKDQNAVKPAKPESVKVEEPNQDTPIKPDPNKEDLKGKDKPQKQEADKVKKDKSEQRMNAEEHSKGNAYSGKGKGGDKDLVDPQKKEKKETPGTKNDPEKKGK